MLSTLEWRNPVVNFMYYVLLLVSVMSFLSFVAWRYPSQAQRFARQAGLTLQRTGKTERPAETRSDFVARLLKGERKEDRPCLTPVDCVKSGRCAGHCGCR